MKHIKSFGRITEVISLLLKGILICFFASIVSSCSPHYFYFEDIKFEKINITTQIRYLPKSINELSVKVTGDYSDITEICINVEDDYFHYRFVNDENLSCSPIETRLIVFELESSVTEYSPREYQSLLLSKAINITIESNNGKRSAHSLKLKEL